MPWERIGCAGCGVTLSVGATEFCRNCGGLLAPIEELGITRGQESWRDLDETDPAERGLDHLALGEDDEEADDAAAAWLSTHDPTKRRTRRRQTRA